MPRRHLAQRKTPRNRRAAGLRVKQLLLAPKAGGSSDSPCDLSQHDKLTRLPWHSQPLLRCLDRGCPSESPRYRSIHGDMRDPEKLVIYSRTIGSRSCRTWRPKATCRNGRALIPYTRCPRTMFARLGWSSLVEWASEIHDPVARYRINMSCADWVRTGKYREWIAKQYL